MNGVNNLHLFESDNRLNDCLSIGFFFCLSVIRPVCLSVCLPAYPSLSLCFSVCLCLSFCLYFCLSLYQLICLPVGLFVFLSVCSTVCLPTYLYVFLPVCLSVLLELSWYSHEKKLLFFSTESEWTLKLARNKAESKLIFQLHVKMATDGFSSLQSKSFSAVRLHARAP